MIIWKILRGFLTFLGFSVLLLAGLGVWGMKKATPELPNQFILNYVFQGTPADKPAAPAWLAAFVPVDLRLADVTNQIYRAATDPRVEALVVRLGVGEYEWTAVQEIRAAVAEFRASGKKAYVFSQGYGDMYSGMDSYYLASAFDEIWLQPVGNVAITGFYAQTPYFKDLLGRLGVNAQMFQKGDYKTGPESLLRQSMSEAQKQTLQSLLSARMADFFEGVALSRGFEAGRIGMLIDGAPYTADEALMRGLVDRVGYLDEMVAHAHEAHTGASALVDLDVYGVGGHVALGKKSASGRGQERKSVALIYINGMIVPEDASGGVFSDPVASAVDIAKDIEAAMLDDEIEAIVVRINSGGGSPAASETIRRAIERAREAGKYVVVSMGNAAASGGYWVAVDANKIYALSGTLTGSIGVYGGKMDLSGAWAHLDVNWEGVKMGNNADMWSANKPFNAEGAFAAERLMDDVYDQFIARVAKGRGFAPEVVEAMAQGRVWTGAQAKERGLIDGIGGYATVLDDVAAHLGLESRGQLDVFEAGTHADPFRVFGQMFSRAKALIAPYYGVYLRVQNPSYGVVYRPELGR